MKQVAVPKPWPYSWVSDEYDVPDGYRWATEADSQLPLVCRMCGASVVHSAVDIHDRWHLAR